MQYQFICAALILVFAVSPSHADLIALHSGSNDPTVEGWGALPGPGGGVSIGGINDGGTAAWFVDDNSTASGSLYFYHQDIGASDILDGNTDGWTLSTTIRVASDEEVAFDGSPFVGYRDGVTGWEMEFGLNASGDTFVRLFTGATTGPIHTLSGNSDYNEFSLVYDPVVASADLFVNGNEVISNYTGFANTDTVVLWGAGRSPDRGQGNYNQVAFSTASVPEPSTFLMAVTVVPVLLCCRRRRDGSPDNNCVHRSGGSRGI